MRRSLTWSALCLLGSTQVYALDCIEAQKQVLALDAAASAQLDFEDVSYSDVPAFVESKPSAKGKTVTTSSFLAGDNTYEQLWCKLKSQDAVAAEAKIKSAKATPDCADLNRMQAMEALSSLSSAAEGLTLDGLGISFVADKDFKTGSQWAPSQVLVTPSAKKISVQAMRLKSAKWIPVIGGMNYCKLLSPAGALKLVQDQMDKPRDETAVAAVTLQKISWNVGKKGQQSALLAVGEDFATTLAEAKGTFIISPGAEIPAEAMVGLAQELTQRGFISFIVQYPKNNSILETFNGLGNSAVHLAEKIKQSPQDLLGVSLSALQGKPIYVVGHSLGGATLAGEIFRKGDASTFDHIFLYGVSSFIKLGGTKVPTSSPLTLLFGEHDGLSGSKIKGFITGFGISFQADSFDPAVSASYPNVSYQLLQGLNHFCIISDASVGNSLLKGKDGPGPQPAVCVAALANALAL